MKKKMIFASLACALCCVSGSLVYSAIDTRAETATLAQEIHFQTEYAVHTEVKIPDSKIVYQNKEYETSVKVVKPNGYASAISDEVLKVDQVGIYRIIYSTVVGDDYVSVEKTFTVSNRSVSFSGEKSSYYYGTHEKYAQTSTGEALEGLVVSLAQGETMHYNQIINLNDFNGKQVFSMFTTPENEPSADATQVLFRFTDVYDPSNYVVVRMKANSSEAASNNRIYCDTKASVHSWHAGMEPFNGDVAVSIAGGSYAVTHDSIEYGSPITFSMGGYVASSKIIGDIQYGVEFDFETNFVYSKTNLQKCPIADLDHPLCFDTPWEGFTTGEVFLSVSGANYEGGTLGMVFTDIAGQDLTVNDFHTDKAPLVEADLGEYTKTTVPKAFVGEKYKLFPATAYDVYDGELQPIVKVYYGYNSTNATRVGIKDGYFEANRKGVYTIEYSAVNAKGLRSVYTVDVEAVVSDERLGISIEGKTTSLGVGNLEKIADSYQLTNVSGRAKVEITATLNGNESVCYQIGEDLLFQPLYVGEYTVVFKYSDYLYTKTESFTCTVGIEGGKPLISDSPKLPHYLIKGESYKIPDLMGYEFTSGVPKTKKCDVFIVEEGKEKRPLDGTTYKPNEGEKVTLVYTLSDGTATVEREFELKIVDTKPNGVFDTGRYFASDNGVATAMSDNVLLSAMKDTTWEFINLLISKKVEWRLRTVASGLNYKYLDFYLEDAVKDKKVKVSLTRNGDLLDVYVNGKNRATISTSFENFVANDLFIVYDEEFHQITINNSTRITLDTYADGTEFEGFPSGSVVFKTGVSGVSGDVQIAFRKINNQNIRKLTADKTAPLAYYTAHRGYQTVGDVVVFDAVYAGDVLSPNVKIKYYVMDLQGNYIKADDGTLMDGTQATDKKYEYTFSAIGTYEVLFEVEDSNKQDEEYSYVIHCVDTQAPQIQLSGGMRTGAVNQEITIASCKFTDDFDHSKIEHYIFVIYPNGMMKELTGNSFTATLAGTYTIQYLALDTDGNVAVESYEVVIS